jgi:hypothetical protein
VSTIHPTEWTAFCATEFFADLPTKRTTLNAANFSTFFNPYVSTIDTTDESPKLPAHFSAIQRANNAAHSSTDWRSIQPTNRRTVNTTVSATNQPAFWTAFHAAHVHADCPAYFQTVDSAK